MNKDEILETLIYTEDAKRSYAVNATYRSAINAIADGVTVDGLDPLAACAPAIHALAKVIEETIKRLEGMVQGMVPR